MARVIYAIERHYDRDSMAQLLIIPIQTGDTTARPFTKATWRGEPIGSLWEEFDGCWARRY